MFYSVLKYARLILLLSILTTITFPKAWFQSFQYLPDGKQRLNGRAERFFRTAVYGKFRGHFLLFRFSRTSALAYESVGAFCYQVRTPGTVKILAALALICRNYYPPIGFTELCTRLFLRFTRLCKES